MLRVVAMFIAASSLPIAALSLQPREAVSASSEAGQSLLDGCGDVPEVVNLVHELGIREDRIGKALSALDDRRTDIAEAREMLTAELRRLKSASQDRQRGSGTHAQRAVDQDIARLVAVYEAMKPKEASEVIASLPDGFAAELLMRVNPETGARILAEVTAEKAAVLTTYMGARSAALK
ncbi:MotE family protein [Paracoccus aerodenitrificans]|uniref:MotE family protein n=1 Tax=Paracoccus aerodenitrificans TaxID=3017781 RepID=UPI0022EFF8EB|nr:hypothetical protein [Paracoccus aerodenitrificans]WBU63956.1 hypothetical protein PAE61_16750 [Paracoccus aerodenitrificans]